MEGKFRSIRFKIWLILSLTLVVFFSSALLLSFAVISRVKNQTIYAQLEIASNDLGLIKRGPGANVNPSTPWIDDFKIKRDKKTSEISIIKPPENRRQPDKRRSNSIDTIFDYIKQTNTMKNKGSIRHNDVYTFYILNWSDNSRTEDEEEAYVLFTSIPENKELQYTLLLGIVTLLLVSFFVSKIIAQKIADPILKLEIFAREVAKRNWKAKVPKTDNDEVGLLAEALEHMKDSLKIAEERDRQFLQSSSHDLKTPVMVIKGYAQSMIDGIKINSDKSEAEIIKIEAEKLERRISQLLKLNTISHSLEYSENRGIVRVDRILNNLVSRFRVVKPELDWIVDLKELEITGDSEALLIAFENIVENQLRFAKTIISVSMLSRNDSEKIEIIISNDGSKFEIDDPNLLFDAYKKDRQGKFGLGLSIARQVINSHNGEISASNIENGVEFRIKI